MYFTVDRPVLFPEEGKYQFGLLALEDVMLDIPYVLSKSE